VPEYYDPDIKILLCNYCEKIDSWKHEDVFDCWWHLFWSDTPGAFINAKKSEYRLDADKFYIVAPETTFSTGFEIPFNQLYIHFTAGPPFEQIKSRIYFFPADEIFRRQVKMLKALIPYRSEKMLQMNLLSHSLLCSVLSGINKNELASSKRCDPKVKNALETLRKETSMILSNETLAENAGMSVNGFIRLFTSELGVTPQMYSRKKRIEKASILLHFTDKKIEEIAKETGFPERHHFSRVFKEITNHSPAEFRQNRIAF